MTNTQKMEIAQTMGVTLEQVEKMLGTLAYRKTYNSRPDVKEKRKVYSKTRNQRLSQLSQLLKGE